MQGIISNADKNSNHQDSPRGMGSPGSESQVTWDEQIRVDQDVGERRGHGAASNNCHQPERNIGKILSQLRELEAAFLAYVHSHQDRLETRLKESKAQEERFLDGAVKLREDILRMLQETESDNSQ